MAYIVLDLEWNQPPIGEKSDQKDAKGHRLRGEIIQIGAVKLRVDWSIADTFKCLVRPIRYTNMNPKVREITGIDDEALKEGLPFKEALRKLNEFCGEYCRLLTWGNDDIFILRDNLRLHGISAEEIPPCYDLQRIYGQQIEKSKKQISLTDAVAHLGEPPYQAHDALNDARSTALVCRHLNVEQGIEEIRRGREKKKTRRRRPGARKGSAPRYRKPKPTAPIKTEASAPAPTPSAPRIRTDQ